MFWSSEHCAHAFVEIFPHGYFLLKDKSGRPFYLEVKSVSLVENNIAKFPDSITKRGMLHMKLFKKPFRPSSILLQNNGRNFPPNYLHETWRDYLYWDTELES